MATGLLPGLEMQVSETQSLVAAPSSGDEGQPAYLTRLATLPDRAEMQSTVAARIAPRAESARLDQIEHALTILASVVARLAKDAQQSRLQLRATEQDSSLQEERRVQRELVRSMQSRLMHIEERMDRRPVQPSVPDNSEVAQQLAASLNSIRDSLTALTKRRPKTVPRPE